VNGKADFKEVAGPTFLQLQSSTSIHINIMRKNFLKKNSDITVTKNFKKRQVINKSKSAASNSKSPVKRITQRFKHQ